MPKLTDPQRWSIALVRHFSSNLSVICSCIVLYQFSLRWREQKRSSVRRYDLITPYHRLMLGFAIADILYAFVVGLGGIMVPASSGAIYGLGNITTCSIQGFFRQFLVATFLYTGSFSVYFLLKIRYNISDHVLYQRYEVWFHIVPWVVAISTATMGVILKIFNPMTIPELGCWVGPYPRGCFSPTGPPCTRGYRTKEWTTVYGFILNYAWLILTFLVVLVSNSMIYHTIWSQEKRNAKYFAARLQRDSSVFGSNSMTNSTNSTVHPPSQEAKLSGPPDNTTTDANAAAPELENSSQQLNGDVDAAKAGAAPEHTIDEDKSDGRDDKASAATTIDSTVTSSRDNPKESVKPAVKPSIKTLRTAATQSILYVSTAFFTTVWTIMPHIAYKLGLGSDWRFFFALMLSTFVPLQGFFNLLIFVRLEYIRLRSTNADWSRVTCLKTCLFEPDLTDPCMFKSRRHSSIRSTGFPSAPLQYKGSS